MEIEGSLAQPLLLNCPKPKPSPRLFLSPRLYQNDNHRPHTHTHTNTPPPLSIEPLSKPYIPRNLLVYFIIKRRKSSEIVTGNWRSYSFIDPIGRLICLEASRLLVQRAGNVLRAGDFEQPQNSCVVLHTTPSYSQ